MEEIVAVLSDIRSVHNVGSIFRTADGAGIKKIFLCGITPTPLDRLGKLRDDFSKVALGSHESVLWEHNELILDTLHALKKEGYVIVAVEQNERSIPYDALDSSYKKIALIVGNEVGGLSSEILNMTDVILEIPMRGEKESLNVSVAFGIVAYAVTKK